MSNPLPKVGTLDFYTAYIVAGLLANGNDSGWLGPYSGATTSIIDPSINGGVVNWKYNFSGAGALTIAIAGTLANPLVPGQRLKIMVTTGAYVVTLAMPSNFFFEHNVTPRLLQNAVGWVEFRYDETIGGGIWTEIGRGSAPATGTAFAAGWQNLSLGSGWAALGGWQAPQYRLDKNGILRMRGMVTTAAGTAANATLFTLPAALAYPGGTAGDQFSVNGYSGAAITPYTLNVNGSGVGIVQQAVGAGGFLSLSSIKYDIEV